ncbi:cytidylyltransferase family protein [Phlyctema vagabunda]|uniref:Cytidylyltransferase family protein n=1 Tax=Phlyctema vagabunda TaxID=108571 RepID=A0ABR4PWS1_9HELO
MDHLASLEEDKEIMAASTAASVQKYSNLLKSFTASSSTFQILHSFGPPRSSQSIKRLYILDSSFNPPTLAHLHIATSSIASPCRLLLLLAIQNADKAPKPLSFPERLHLLTIFASSLSKRPQQQDGSRPEHDGQDLGLGIDIGVTKLPYFHSKASSIRQSGEYATDPEQIHLTGFDTLIRILDPKYYDHGRLDVLQGFFETSRLNVTLRDGGQWGERAQQEDLLRKIASGELEGIGARREWVTDERIVLVEGRGGSPISEFVSSQFFLCRFTLKKERLCLALLLGTVETR